MKEEKNKIVEEFADERLILDELNEDNKKIKMAFLGIGILFFITIIGGSYLILRDLKNKNTLNDINQLIPSPSETSTPTPTEVFQISPTPIRINTKVSQQAAIKEYFIPFGTGSSQANDWADVPGMQANINFENYQNIKEIRFEVSVSVPTANQTVSIRLFNVTDKHPVWNSEITTSNNIYAVSSPITYDNGVKTYQVQMKTQLGYLANLTQARLHIILK